MSTLITPRRAWLTLGAAALGTAAMLAVLPAATGPASAAGKPIPPSLAVQVVSATATSDAAGNFDGTATCPATWRATGGGYLLGQPTQRVQINWPVPPDGGTPTGWRIAGDNTLGAPTGATVYVVCAQVTGG